MNCVQHVSKYLRIHAERCPWLKKNATSKTVMSRIDWNHAAAVGYPKTVEIFKWVSVCCIELNIAHRPPSFLLKRINGWVRKWEWTTGVRRFADPSLKLWLRIQSDLQGEESTAGDCFRLSRRISSSSLCDERYICKLATLDAAFKLQKFSRIFLGRPYAGSAKLSIAQRCTFPLSWPRKGE